jgi:predicted transcriptional regulator
VIQKIDRGLKDKEEGRIYEEKEIEEKMSKWL